MELQEVLDFAATINNGDAPKALTMLKGGNPSSAIEHHPFNREEETERHYRERVLDHAVNLFPAPTATRMTPENY